MIRTEWRTGDIWLRREFDISEASLTPKQPSLALRVHHDEDAEIYLNGVSIARLPGWTTGYVDMPLTAQVAEALRPGRNVLAVHCHQNGGGQYIDVGLLEYVDAAK